MPFVFIPSSFRQLAKYPNWNNNYKLCKPLLNRPLRHWHMNGKEHIAEIIYNVLKPAFMSYLIESNSWFQPNPYPLVAAHSKTVVPDSFFKVDSLADFYVDLFMEKTSRTMGCYAVVWLQKGCGTISIDLNKYPITENMLLFFTPGQLLQMDADENISGTVLSFSADFLLSADKIVTDAFSEVSFSDKQFLRYPDAEVINELEDIISKMKREQLSASPYRNQILNGLLRIFILYLSKSQEVIKQDRTPVRDREMVRNFMNLIKSNFLIKKMVTDYAKELCVSPNYLNRVVKKISGNTASYHIQQCIVIEAKRQAVHSNLSMKEIAYALGFNDYAHFSKFFKNNSGINFSCFKNAMG